MPLSFCVYSLVVIWYTLHGYHPEDLTGRRAEQPWYSHKDDIAFEDMLAKLRRTLVAERITGVDAAQPDPRKYRDYELACAAARRVTAKLELYAYMPICRAERGRAPGSPFVGPERNRPFRLRCDRQRRVNTQVGRDRRTVNDMQTGIPV